MRASKTSKTTPRSAVVLLIGTSAEAVAIRIAAASLAEHAAGFDTVVLVADAQPDDPPVTGSAQLCAADLIGLPAALRRGYLLSPDAYVESLVPAALAHLGRRGYQVRIALPARSLVVGELDPLLRTLERGDVDPDPGFETGWWGRVGDRRRVTRHHPDLDEVAPIGRATYTTAVVVLDDEFFADPAQARRGAPARAAGNYRRLRRAVGEAGPRPYRFAFFSDGVPFDGIARGLLRQATDGGERFGDPGDVRADPSFRSWLSAPPPGRRLSRYLTRYLEMRPGLRRQFRNAARHPDPFLTFLRAERPAEVHAVWYEAQVRRELHGACGANIVGFFRGEFGIGESARSLARACEVAGEPTALLDFAGEAPHRQEDITIRDYSWIAPYPVSILCANPPEFPAFERHPAHVAFDGPQYRIGVWWWELPELPATWCREFNRFDEVWVGSRFVFDAVCRVATVPVAHVPPIVEARPVGVTDRRHYGLEPHEATFLFVFDFRSIWERKNPDGVIAAFQSAFPNDRDVRLVIKTINGEFAPERVAQLRARAGSDPRITLMDRYLDRGQLLRLMQACDCYVSLHRAEGFGLTIAEAMAYGVPVVATAWSGNLDYMNEANSFLVYADPVKLDRDYGPYPRGATWAEPDVEHAAFHLRRVRDEPLEAVRRASRGRADLRERCSAAKVGLIVRERLDAIRRSLRTETNV